MFGPSGLVATIITFNPGIALLSLTVAALLSVPVALLLYAGKVKRWRVLLACFFVGTVLTGHVGLSRLANLTPMDVEVVKVWGGSEEEKPR